MLQIFNHQMTPANTVLKPAEIIRYLKKHKTKPMFLFMSTLVNRNSDIICTLFTLIFLNRVPSHIFSLLSQCLC